MTIKPTNKLTSTLIAALAMAGTPQVWSQALPAAGQSGQTTAPLGISPISRTPTASAVREVSAVDVVPVQFTFTGNASIASEVLAQLVLDKLGQRLDLGGLDQVADRISRHYRAKGFTVARAYLPPQQITEGNIMIAVIEGQLGAINLKNNSQIDSLRLTKTLAANLCANADVGGSGAAASGNGCKGAVLQDAGLERAVLILKDLPGATATANIKPGQAVGTSDLDVAVHALKSEAYSMGLDNYGSASTGKIRVNANADLHNLGNDGDTLSLGYATTLKRSTNTGSIAYSLPAGYRGARVGVALARGQYRLGQGYSDTNSHGTSNSLSLYGSYPVVRSVNNSFYVRGSAEVRGMYDSIDLTNISYRKNATVLRAGFNGDNVDGLGGGGYTVYGATLSTGLLNTSDAADLTGAKVGGKFSKLAYNLGRQQALYGPITLYGSVNGQIVGGRNLDGSEQIGIGGPGAVRGYAGEAGGSQGIVGNLELRHTQPILTSSGGKPVSLTSAIFVDRGWVNAYKDTSGVAAYKRALGGYGVSLSAQSSSLYVRAVYAGHSGAQPSLITPNSTTNFWLQAGLNY
jgi:hemolysin activation/secretion protein